MPAADALAAAGITPVVLREKEGLALINGTDGMLGMLTLATHDLALLFRTADLAAAMSVEALLGTDAVFAADLQALRPHPGQAVSAANLRALLAGSADRGQPPRTGDAPACRTPTRCAARRRCTAPAATPSRTPAWSRDRELASAVDNPVVTLDGRVESNGNFHGAPVGYVLDFLAIAAADLASIAERRTDRLLDQARNHGLPPFLADDPGRRLRPHDRPVHPGRDGLGAEAAGRARLRRLDPVQRDAGGPRLDGLVGRAQAAPRRRRADPGAGDRAPHRGPGARPARAAHPRPGDRPPSATPCASTVAGPGPDRYLAPEIAAAVELVRSGRLVAAAEAVCGPLR